MRGRVVAGVFAAAMVVSTVINSWVFGDGASAAMAIADHPLTTATAKLLYRGVSDCIAGDKTWTGNTFNYEGLNIFDQWIDAANVANGTIFLEEANGQVLREGEPSVYFPFGATYDSNYGVSLTGEATCRDLFLRASGAEDEPLPWGVTRNEIYCNGAEPGIIAPDKHDGVNSDVRCDLWFGGGRYMEDAPKHAITSHRDPSFDPQEHLERLQQITFGGRPPGGSLELTRAEEWAWFDSWFVEYCDAGEGPNGEGATKSNFDLAMDKIVNGKIERQYYFSAQEDPSGCWAVAKAVDENIEAWLEDPRNIAQFTEDCEARGGTFEIDPDGGYECANVAEEINPDPDVGGGVSEKAAREVAILDKCNGSAGTFSWVVCPMLVSMMNTSSGLFNFVEDFLKVRTELVDPDSRQGGAAVFEMWGIMRDLANVVLVVLFIAVVISQVTGFGIDNYGIKRMLPRLIVIGLLINLSYIVCQLAVDLSNIFGANLYGLLKGMTNNLDFNAVAMAGAVATLSGILLVIIGIILLLAVPTFGLILIPLLLALLGGVISILFVFLLLGVRQAAVVLFVILAPVAFAANILPNTQGLFKRWWNIFKTLLILYPICGLAMGGGYAGARILMALSPSSGELSAVFGVVSIILLFAPIFFIPKLVKGAFDGLGKIGGAIAGLGGKFSGTVRSKAEAGIKGSERYKTAQQNQLRNRALERAGQVGAIKTKGLRGAVSRARARLNQGLNNLSPNSDVRRNLQLAGASVISAQERENIKNEEALFDLQNPDAELGQAEKFFADAMASNDDAKMTAAANVMDRFGVKGIDSMAKYFANLSDNDRAGAIKGFARVANRMPGMIGKIDGRAADFGQSLKDREDRFGSASVLGDMDAPQLASQGTDFYRRMAERFAAGSSGAELVNATLNSTSPAVRDKLTKEGRAAYIAAMVQGGANVPVAAPAGGGGGGAPTGGGAPAGGGGGAPTGAPAPTPAVGAPAAPAGAPSAPVANVPTGADRLNAQTGNVRGNVTGANGGRIIVQGPDAGAEQTDSGIIIAH